WRSARPTPARWRRRAAASADPAPVRMRSWRTEDAAAEQASRVRLTGGHPVQGRAHGRAVLAGQADDHENRSMYFDDAFRVAAGDLVKAVDVLVHARVQTPGQLQIDQGRVAGVRPGRPGDVLGPAHPGPPAYVRVAHVRVQRDQPGRLRVAGPDTVGAAEVGD